MTMNNSEYNRLKISDKKKVDKYFNKLSNMVKLPMSKKNLFIKDFENIIIYYLKNNESVDNILKKISLDNLGDIYTKESKRWFPLDSAAKIYPLAMKSNYKSVYRLSYYLKKEIVPEVLQVALLFTMKRFPTFMTSVRKGFFWHYLDSIKKRFHVTFEVDVPFSNLNVSSMGKQSFKIVYYDRRVSIECFHVLTDAKGACTFLTTLIGEYFKLLGDNVSYNDILLDVNGNIDNDELIDEFLDKKGIGKKKILSSKAIQLDGKIAKVKPCQIIHFDMDKNELLKICHKKDITMTNLFLSFIFIACSCCTSKDGKINIQLPVNMRKYYNSKTLRNFSLFVNINLDKKDVSSLDSTIDNIKIKMDEMINKKYLDSMITFPQRIVSYLKFVPLFIKGSVFKLAFGFVEDSSETSALSNLGNIELPVELRDKVEKMDFILGTSTINRVLFGLVTCNDITTLSVSKFTKNTSLENNLYNLITNEGIKVKVYGSDIYERRK